MNPLNSLQRLLLDLDYPEPYLVGMEMVEETKNKSWIKRNYIKILVVTGTVLAIVAMLIIGLVYKERIEDFKNYGYLGVFLMGLAGSVAPIWPLPGSWAAFLAAGAGLNIFYIALAAGTGEAIGELSGYMLGYGGQSTIIKISQNKRYQWVERWMRRRGNLSIFLFAAVPNPHIIKVVYATAGALRFNVFRVFIICWTGKVIKSFAFAIAGADLLPWFTDVVERIFGK